MGIYSIALEPRPINLIQSQISSRTKLSRDVFMWVSVLAYVPLCFTNFLQQWQRIVVLPSPILTAQSSECDSCFCICFRDFLTPVTPQWGQSNLRAMKRPSVQEQSTPQASVSKATSHVICQVTPAHLKPSDTCR